MSFRRSFRETYKATRTRNMPLTPDQKTGARIVFFVGLIALVAVISVLALR